MATFVVLICYTDQGIRKVKDTAKRADAMKEMVEKIGVTVKGTYWTLGQYDGVAIFDAPDDATMAAVAYSLAELGNVRTQTLRAFSETEVDAILRKVV